MQGLSFPYLQAFHSKASLFHVPLFLKAIFFFCRCCCLCPSRPRYAPSVTIEEDNCCGCNAIAIRRHFLDENMTSVDIVYTSCHDAVSRICNPLHIWGMLLRPFLMGFTCFQVQWYKEGNLSLFVTLESPILSLSRNAATWTAIFATAKNQIIQRSALPIRHNLSRCSASFSLSRRVIKQECLTKLLQQWIFSRFMKRLSMWQWTMIRRRWSLVSEELCLQK